jgi:hypothetical protein
LGNELDGLVDLIFGSGGDDDRSARLSEADGNRPAKAATASGDDRDLSFQVLHL